MAARAGTRAEAVVTDRGTEGDEDGEEQEQQEQNHGSNSSPRGFLPPEAGMPWLMDILPRLCHGEGMTTVAVIVSDGLEPFGLGVLAEVWGEGYHPEDENPVFDFRVCTERPGAVATEYGFEIVVRHDLASVADADVVAVAAKRDRRREEPAVSQVLREAHDRGAVIIASCSAVFTLGDAGLLDGRRSTTHWRYGAELQEAFPRTTVDTDVLYIDDGDVVTGAGSAAGIDANLHLMRRLHGSRTAATAARRIVVPPHRDGGQAQFIRTPLGLTECDTLGPLLAWAGERLHEPLPVERLAAQAHMSARTFARRFRDETGTTPLQWLTSQRVALAEELLENSDLSIEQIAHRVGFGNAATLRHHFAGSRGTSPQAYRRSFGCLDAS
ncbi:transcriptional regulator, AraC family [Aeromicrobium marinum DSM 15272]|uniref:Transcriptional regulator, AraC family n=2 Tax=Aeromicrobium marinum TaxID=219314 RepID=E2SAD8_9ACTN|nr:transcriptional regulator, AraC family [Aeromicrobium marinum DSM 15272]